MTVRIDLTNLPRITNPIYYPHFRNQDRYLILYGGAGSGKSHFIGQKIIFRMITEEGHRFLILRKVARTLRNSVFQLMQDTINFWGLAKLFKINKSDMEIVYLPNGNKIWFAGLDDVEKLKSIQGITSVWIEEASEITQVDFQQVNLRLRGITKNYKQIIISFNPISANHWLKKYFFDSRVEHSTIVKSTYLDNRFIDAEYRQALEDLKNKDFMYYSIYALGEWGVLGNLIFTNWESKEISLDDNQYNHVISYGLDFGFNDPSALVKVAMTDQDIYILDELYESKLTNSDLIIRAKSMIPDLRSNITADSAEQDRIEEFRRAGFKKIKGAKKGKDSIRHGIDWLKARKIYIHPSCVNTIREFSLYKWKEDKDGTVFDVPVDLNNHTIDATRYAVEDWRLDVKASKVKINNRLSKLGIRI